MVISLSKQPPILNIEPEWRYWLRRLTPTFDLTPIRITVAYAVFGLSALFLSDVIFARYISEPLLSQVQALKGGIEVAVTAGLIFLLTTHRESQLARTQNFLEQRQEELEVLHQVLRHNLRNDINVAAAYARMTREEVDSEELSEHCEKVLEVIDRIAHYTDRAKQIERITENNHKTREIRVGEAISAVLKRNQDRLENVSVTTEIPESVRIEANPAFQDAMNELVTNAIEHNDSDSPLIRIEVETDIEPSHMVDVHVSDNGPAIPDVEQQVMDRNGRGEGPLIHSSGLGLWIVTWIVEASGGELRLTESELGGTKVTVRLPKSPEMLTESLI